MTLPYPFVEDLLLPLEIVVKQFFGGYGIYHGDKILMILYAREKGGEDKGVWLATSREHHKTLKELLPSLKNISVLGNGDTNWQCLPESSPEFERDVTTACELILASDPRIGRIPVKKKKRKKV